MGHETKTVAAGEFKARCLALLDEVAERGEVVVVTKRGVPVAKVVPVDQPERPSLRGSVVSEKDIVAPIEGAWDAEG
ncbi:MAG: type II toxin-antitoxin system Phd/YefM family antitoxin [Myxococcales bacterium]|nr:type II toxin-antitoxin system Phd/YefM family antitoxin [Myxococcales bacterium]